MEEAKKKPQKIKKGVREWGRRWESKACGDVNVMPQLFLYLYYILFSFRKVRPSLSLVLNKFRYNTFPLLSTTLTASFLHYFHLCVKSELRK